MVHQHRVKRGLYRDSVALMRLSAALAARLGIRQASALMATPANLAAQAAAGLPLPNGPAPRPDDLLLTVKADDLDAAGAALDWAEAELYPQLAPGVSGPAEPGAPEWRPGRLAEAVPLEAGPGVAVISVPGEYAFAEALKALKLGQHVFLFSSGVSLADEVRLKALAAERGRLVMGPDCGTAFYQGVPLGFANVVRAGGVGLVAASGSGLQEVMCLIHQGGGGIRQAIGTGGRDLHAQVGARTMLAGLRLLASDPATRAIVLLSKPAPAAVTESVLQAAAGCGKPVVVAIVGADLATVQAAGLQAAATLEEAARLALAAEGLVLPAAEMPAASARAEPGRRWVRGLFTGGTLATEARLTLQAAGLANVTQPGPGQPWPAGHLVQDLGDEALTQGRPHPMIDGRLRAEAVARATADPATAVVLFDVVLGWGAALEPLAELLPIVAQAPAGVRWVARVCGTEADPQGLPTQVARLEQAGVTVMASNAAAARLAARWARVE